MKKKVFSTIAARATVCGFCMPSHLSNGMRTLPQHGPMELLDEQAGVVHKGSLEQWEPQVS